MFVLLLGILLIATVHGDCTNRTCLYGHCANNSCLCDPGITGSTCNTDIADCDANACSNNGACLELVNGFACQCLPDFDGSRCQYRRTIDENHCKKQCYNNGKCIVTNNAEKCICLPPFSGPACEHVHDHASVSSVQKCSLLKYRNSHHTGTCVAIGLTPLSDVHCECRLDLEDKHIANCQIIPTVYSDRKCSFKKHIGSSKLSALPDTIWIYVCPVNWQLLDQYENTQEKVNSVHKTQCRLIDR